MLLLTFVTLGLGVTAALSAWNSSRIRLDHERKTELALQQAKEALISYAVAVDLTGSKRPGDLPCPDLDNDGKKETSCGNSSGSTGQGARLGRLPWKDLGLPDLRDASGERLWYAVSNNFKENTRHLPLNSDSSGTIQVVDAAGAITSNVVAVVIAPGPPLQRLDAGSIQDRIPANVNNPASYLETSGSEDNASFSDGTTDGFVAGPILDGAGRLVVNDRILTITYEDLMPAIELRVAREVLSCLQNYAAISQGRYPWAADITASAGGTFDDVAATRFGRVPDRMCNTGGNGVGDPVCTPIVGTNPSMQVVWGAVPNCVVANTWFVNNWRDQVFYAIADAFKPGSGIPSGCGSCLTVDLAANVRVAVVMARKTLSNLGQTRLTSADRALLGSYLEGENKTPADNIFQSPTSTLIFNDMVVYQ